MGADLVPDASAVNAPNMGGKFEGFVIIERLYIDGKPDARKTPGPVPPRLRLIDSYFVCRFVKYPFHFLCLMHGRICQIAILSSYCAPSIFINCRITNHVLNCSIQDY